jgi:hypothetical protein
MRRSLGSGTVSVLLAALLAGCDAVGNTSSLQAIPFEPKAGVCHPVADRVGYRASYAPVDCAQPHRLETVLVGTYTGPDAARVTPPPNDSSAMRAAFQVCDAAATKFVGADWRGGLLGVQVVNPSLEDWTGGGRWYRCDLFTALSMEGDSAATERTGSLRGEFTHPSPLAYGCYNADKDNNLSPLPCTKPHRYEYVGIWTAPEGTYLAAERDPKPIFGHCRDVIAPYTRGTAYAKSARYSGTTFRLPSRDAWALGNHGIRCFYWSDERDMTRSLKAG